MLRTGAVRAAARGHAPVSVCSQLFECVVPLSLLQQPCVILKALMISPAASQMTHTSLRRGISPSTLTSPGASKYDIRALTCRAGAPLGGAAGRPPARHPGQVLAGAAQPAPGQGRSARCAGAERSQSPLWRAAAWPNRCSCTWTSLTPCSTEATCGGWPAGPGGTKWRR